MILSNFENFYEILKKFSFYIDAPLAMPIEKMVDFATQVSYNINDTCVANIVGESL